MNENDFNDLLLGLDQVLEHARGANTKLKVTKVKIFVEKTPVYNADQIKELRYKLELTQKYFAELLGVSQRTVEAWESGKNIPNGAAMRLMKIYNDNPNLSEADIKREVIHS